MRSICSLIAAVPLCVLGIEPCPRAGGQGREDRRFRPRSPGHRGPQRRRVPVRPDGTEAFKDLVARMKKTIQDDQVKAVVLPARRRVGWPCQIGELRSVMSLVKAAGKDDLHAESLSMSQYARRPARRRSASCPKDPDDHRRPGRGALLRKGCSARSQGHARLHDVRRLQRRRDFLCGPAHRRGRCYRGDDQLATARQPLRDERRSDRRGASRLSQEGPPWIDGGLYTAAKAKKAGIIDTVEFARTSDRLKSKWPAAASSSTKSMERRNAMKSTFPRRSAWIKLWSQILQGLPAPRFQEAGRGGGLCRRPTCPASRNRAPGPVARPIAN